VNDALRTGQLTVHPTCGDLIYQLMHLTKGDKGIERPDEECDEADAMQYAFSAALHYLSEPEAPKHALHSEEKLWESIERREKKCRIRTGGSGYDRSGISKGHFGEHKNSHHTVQKAQN
jgi:hypothetical protein